MEEIRLQEKRWAEKRFERELIATRQALTNVLCNNEALYDANSELEEKLEKANEEIEELKIYRLQYLELLQRTVEK